MEEDGDNKPAEDPVSDASGAAASSYEEEEEGFRRKK